MRRNHQKAGKTLMAKRVRLSLMLALTMMLLQGCSYNVLFWERNMWQDLHGIFTMVEPADMALYRQLLPEPFALPDQPMVGVFVADYLDVEPWMIPLTKHTLIPYQEASIFLRCKYEDRVGWYCLTMPVTDEGAMIGGHRLGFPKYVADSIVLYKDGNGWIGNVLHQGKHPIMLEFTPAPLTDMSGLVPIHDTFMKGDGDARLEGPIILLKPPGVGPKVNVIPASPPPLAVRETGLVKITLAEPWNGLVPDGTVSPGLFQRFTLGAGK